MQTYVRIQVREHVKLRNTLEHLYTPSSGRKNEPRSLRHASRILPYPRINAVLW